MFEWFANFVVYDLIGLEAETAMASALHFFIYDTFKILFLIFIVVSVITLISTFLPSESIKKRLNKARFGIGNILAALFGAMTPFCSCSSIPIFLGFIKARIPLGIAFSFLITSPLVNEVAFVIMGGLFGWKLALLYALAGITLGVIGGLLLGAMKMEKYIILEKNGDGGSTKVSPKLFKDKLVFAIRQGGITLKKLLPYVIGGLAIGALIHGYLPAEFFTKYLGGYKFLSVPIAALVGVPIYAGCSAVAPLIFGITANGVPLGTSLALMMSIAGLSLPEAIILKRVMKIKLLAIFFGLVTVGIIIIGLLFNL
jgi:uncharacterized protein